MRAHTRTIPRSRQRPIALLAPRNLDLLSHVSVTDHSGGHGFPVRARSCMSVHTSIYMPMHMSTHIGSACLYTCPYARLSACLCTCPYAWLYACPCTCLHTQALHVRTQRPNTRLSTCPHTRRPLEVLHAHAHVHTQVYPHVSAHVHTRVYVPMHMLERTGSAALTMQRACCVPRTAASTRLIRASALHRARH